MSEALENLASYLAKEPLRALREKKLQEKAGVEYAVFRQAIERLRFFPTPHTDFSEAEVTIGKAGELPLLEQTRLFDSLQVFRPWKKGPFRIFGEPIDAEWQADWKWGRILPHCPDLAGKTIADIGCHNGYYMFRMAAHKPLMVVGFEPVIKHWLCFDLLQGFAQVPNLHFEPLGVETIDAFPSFFDVIFCLGILYHHTDPVGLLQKMRKALQPGGTIIIDCQGVQHDDSIALVPKNTYAGSSGMWFLPSLSCLLNWVRRSGFQDVVCFYQAQVSELEQRSTPWAPIKSLGDFLSPIDRQKTIEGYPRPWRFYVRAKK